MTTKRPVTVTIIRCKKWGECMRIYVVQVMPEASLGRVSQEGYTSLEKAQAFIESRSDKPTQVTPWHYRSTDGNFTDYLIYEVRVI